MPFTAHSVTWNKPSHMNAPDLSHPAVKEKNKVCSSNNAHAKVGDASPCVCGWHWCWEPWLLRAFQQQVGRPNNESVRRIQITFVRPNFATIAEGCLKSILWILGNRKTHKLPALCLDLLPGPFSARSICLWRFVWVQGLNQAGHGQRCLKWHRLGGSIEGLHHQNKTFDKPERRWARLFVFVWDGWGGCVSNCLGQLDILLGQFAAVSQKLAPHEIHQQLQQRSSCFVEFTLQCVQLACLYNTGCCIFIVILLLDNIAGSSLSSKEFRPTCVWVLHFRNDLGALLGL